MEETASPRMRTPISTYRIAQIVLGVLFIAYVAWRMYTVIFVQAVYGPDTWVRFAISGLILGSVYAVIAIGYTLVYGILFMINFAHGDVMMLGAFAGFFVFEALNAWKVGPDQVPFVNASVFSAIISIILAFVVGMVTATVVGVYLERIAYRPLRKAPRLVPLISAIGASIFLENWAQLMFSPQRRTYANPGILTRNEGWTLLISGRPVIVTYTGVFTFIMSILLLVILYVIVQRTRLGRAMRAVAQDKQTSALMGIDVDGIISQTFAISGAMAGAAGVLWGIHNGIIYHYVGFVPGLKAFTAAVLGGIGNVPGAMVGGMVLGLIEALGPALLGIGFQLKDVLAFSILVLVLIFRPTGLLGEVLSEEKV